MNQVEAIVTKIISKKPVFEFDKYWMKVDYKCYGLNSTAQLMFDTEQEAKSLKVGDTFLY